MDQPDLPASRPMLDVFLPLDCGKHILMPCGINQAVQAIVLGEPAYEPLLVLSHTTPPDVAGDADIQRSIATVGHDVDPAGRHLRQLSARTVKKAWTHMPRRIGSGYFVPCYFVSSNFVSWPGLVRPSTPFLPPCNIVVGGRAKPGHDTKHNRPHRSLASAQPRPSVTGRRLRATKRRPR